MVMGVISGIGSVLGGLGGLFGKKKKDPTPRENLLSQAQGAREAAEKYGFNPLTMLQYGQAGGAMGGGGGGAAPLASIQMLTEGLQGLDDIVSGDRARRRKADQLEIDLAEIKLDQARSGVILPPPVASGVGLGRSPLGRSAVTVPTVGGATFAEGSTLSMGDRPPRSPISRARDMIPVIYPDGRSMSIPRGVADRLGVQPFGTLIAGDLEELRGEFVGNVESTTRSADIATYTNTGTPVDPLGVIEFDPEGKKWVPPFTNPKSEYWFRRPIF